MSKRLRNRIVLVGGFFICLGIIITAIILIIVAICGGFSNNNSIDRDVAELAGVEVVYDTSAEPVKPVVSVPANDTSSTADTSSDVSSDVSAGVSSDTSSEETPVSSKEPISSETSSTDTSSADTSATASHDILVNSGTEKTPEDFVADFVNNVA